MSIQPHPRREAEASEVRSFATRSLDVLRAIDKTLDGLDENITLLEGIVRDVEGFQARLCKDAIEGRVDADGAIAGILDAAIDAVAHVHAGWQSARAAMMEGGGGIEARPQDRTAPGPPPVGGEKAWGGPAGSREFDACVGLVQRLHAALTALSAWIATHDALLDAPLPGVYESADDLFNAIGIKP
jgi:hypothetical protein